MIVPLRPIVASAALVGAFRHQTKNTFSSWQTTKRDYCSYNKNARSSSPATALAAMQSNDGTNMELLNFESFLEEDALNSNANLLVEPPVMFFNEDDDSSSFDFERWESHRSSDRYGRLLSGLFVGVTTKRIRVPILVLALWSAAVDIYNSIEDLYGFPEVELPLTPFELTAPVLGLLLVFRSNTAYERFNKGSETTWEITGTFKSMIRSLISWTAQPQQFSNEERVAAYELAEACVLLHGWIMTEYLRSSSSSSSSGSSKSSTNNQKQKMDSKKMQKMFFEKALGISSGADATNGKKTPEQEQTNGNSSSSATAAQQQVQLPSSILSFSSRLTPSVGATAISLGIATRLPSLDTQETTRLDELLETLISSTSICEQLLRTPIPLGYTRYSVRFLWAWLLLLPFALVHTFATFGSDTWWEDKPQPVVFFAMVFISFTYLSIEDISVQIEEPFAVLPLEMHQQWLIRDVKQMTQLSRLMDQQATTTSTRQSSSSPQRRFPLRSK
mmetsp:Transcript_13489/g.19887  ORF Transcript_13489/g.19887 Transcript_13489/m.19887 type:complete len:503 (-) Transcript_13489:18-1526(-)